MEKKENSYLEKCNYLKYRDIKYNKQCDEGKIIIEKI
jgi:hypothetical protein